MATVIDDRVQETTTTTGTSTYTLAGAKTGFQSFANIGDGNDTYYCCTDGTDYEVGVGTYTASGTTLSRTTILDSTNSGSAVNWSAGSRDIFCTMPAGKVVFEDSSNNVAVAGTVDGRDLATDGAKLDGIASGATNTAAPFYTSAITSSDVTTALGFTPYGPDATAQFDSVELGDTSGPILSQERDQNMKLQGSSGTDVGITGYDSTGTWRFQLYGGGSQSGFLNSNWGGWAAYVTTSGDWTAAGNVTAYSDIRLKDLITTIDKPLEKISEIRGVTYNRNDIEGNPRQTGVIAQEVEKVLPEVVQTSEDGIKHVAYGNMIGLLIEGIKELKQEIEKLKNGVTN